MHRQVATNCAGKHSILELGAGTLNHVPYEHRAEIYDVVEPFQELFANSPNRSLVREIYSNIEAVPKSNTYDRVLSIAVLDNGSTFFLT